MPFARRTGVSSFFALSSLAAAFVTGGSIQNKQDTVWKRYYNPEAGYCVDYPARWYKADAFDGSGLYVMTGMKKHSRATGEIDIGRFRESASKEAHPANISLQDVFQTHMDGLKKFERAERMEVLEQRPMDIGGVPGLFTKDRYYDPQDRSTWMEEVLFIQSKGEMYRIELECKADQMDRFEPVFSHLVSTIQFSCSSPHGSN
jgi:hypothetical protein